MGRPEMEQTTMVSEAPLHNDLRDKKPVGGTLCAPPEGCRVNFKQPHDQRHAGCRKKYDLSSMPTVSVVIPYLYEDFMMMQQTIASLLANTPHELLDTILFVD